MGISHSADDGSQCQQLRFLSPLPLWIPGVLLFFSEPICCPCAPWGPEQPPNCGSAAWLLWFLAEAILFWNGILCVYFTSVQLGIRIRVVDALCSWIPIANLFILHRTIRTTDSEVNIIAHSMGGLGCRCAIANTGAASYVASLTSITPTGAAEC